MSYSKKVIDHYENPRNVGSFDKDDPTVGTGLVGAPACGDVLKLQIKIDPDTDTIVDAKWKTYGCLTSNMPINTPTKRKKISELKIGDEVLAWDGNTIHPQKIKDIIKHSVEINDLLKVTFQKETSRKNIKPGIFSIICTKEHIFWNSNNSPAEAQNLVPGQELYEITDNVIKIISISPITHHNELRGCERDGKKVVVYDLKLEEGAHVFFSNRVGSHNCGSAIASSSLVSEMIKGLTISEALEIKNTDIANELALPPVKIHCSILAEDSLKAAIADYKNKQNK